MMRTTPITKLHRTWQYYLVAGFWITALATGLYQLVFGEFVIGVYLLLSTTAITWPGIFTRNRVKSLPIELQLAFSLMVFLALVLGETFNFYWVFPYYDKVVHFSLPFFTGLVCFLLAHALHKTGSLRLTNLSLIIIVALITMGIGGIWEIIEFLWDTYLRPFIDLFGPLQGSPTETPLIDTMHDLMFDLLGGIAGAVVGLYYTKSQDKRDDSPFMTLISEIASGLLGHKQK